MYSTDPVVVAPDLYQNIVASNVTYEVAISKCKEIGENIKMPNIDEMTSLFYNKILIGNGVDTTHWSSTTTSNGRIWSQALTSGRRLYDVSNSKWRVRCVKR